MGWGPVARSQQASSWDKLIVPGSPVAGGELRCFRVITEFPDVLLRSP